MIRITYILVSALALLGANAASSVVDLIPSNFDDVVLKSNKPALVEFFAPWCGHCKTLAPVFEDLAANFAYASDKVTIGKVDADDHKSLGKRFGVQGFPTLKWFDGVNDKPQDYTGGRDLESLTAWITKEAKLKPKTKKIAPSAVEYLNDKTFKAEIGGEKDVLLAFTTSWCGHCKSLAPIWESVAQDYASESSILVAKIDAEAENAKATAKEQGVASYPTIKFFPKGSKEAVAYEGGRTESDFVAFLNEKAGTHRAIGGGLDANAGTIEALDTIIAKISTGSSMATISEDVTKIAKDLTDKYAPYYVKVLAKLGASQGYVEKELIRLQGLLKNGGLAQEKLDDLTSRMNILSKFGSTAPRDEL